jgi:hypothetical protein
VTVLSWAGDGVRVHRLLWTNDLRMRWQYGCGTAIGWPGDSGDAKTYAHLARKASGSLTSEYGRSLRQPFAG